MESESYFLQAAEKEELVSNCKTYAKHYEELEKTNRDRRNSSIPPEPPTPVSRLQTNRGMGRDMVHPFHRPSSHDSQRTRKSQETEFLTLTAVNENKSPTDDELDIKQA